MRYVHKIIEQIYNHLFICHTTHSLCQSATKPLQNDNVQNNTEPLVESCNVILTVNKFSSKCVVTKEESTSKIKWLDIVAGRRAIQRDFKMSTLHEIPTVMIGLVVSKV